MFLLAASASQLRELASTIAVVAIALLIALLFQARMLDFRNHHAWQPRSVVAALGGMAAIFVCTEGAALLALAARNPRTLTLASATGLVLIFALVLSLLFEQWLAGLRQHARERHHEAYGEAAGRAVEWAQWAIAGASVVVIVVMWWQPLG